MVASAGMNLDRAAELAARLGATVSPVRRTGELRFRHGSMKPCRGDGRRKDAPRHLTSWLRRLERLAEGGG